MSSQGIGLMASASYDQTIRVWTVNNGKHIGTLPHGDAQVNSMALTPSGHQLAVASWQRIRLYDMTTATPTSQLLPNPMTAFEAIAKNVTVVGFEALGRWMYTGGEDCTCRIYEMRGTQIKCSRILELLTPVLSVALHHNQLELFVSDSSGCVYIWDLRLTTRNPIPMPPMGYQETVTRLTVHPNAKILTGITNRGNLITWDLTFSTDEKPQIIQGIRLDGTVASLREQNEWDRDLHPKYGLSCRYSPCGTLLVTTGSDTSVNILNTEDHSLRSRIQTESDWIWDASFSCDSKFLFTAGSDSRVNLWNVDTGERVMAFEGHTKPLTAFCMNDLTALANSYTAY